MGSDPKRINKKSSKKERLIEKQLATKIADNPRRVFDRRINERSLLSLSFSYERDRFWELRDADSAKAVGTGCIGKHL